MFPNLGCPVEGARCKDWSEFRMCPADSCHRSLMCLHMCSCRSRRNPDTMCLPSIHPERTKSLIPRRIAIFLFCDHKLRRSKESIRVITFGQDYKWQGVDRRSHMTHLSPSHRVHAVSILPALLKTKQSKLPPDSIARDIYQGLHCWHTGSGRLDFQFSVRAQDIMLV